MLEILIIIGLYSILSKKLRMKGLDTNLAWVGPGLWVGGELVGAAFGFLFLLAIGWNPSFKTVYPFGIFWGLVGAITAYFIVTFHEPLTYMCPNCENEVVHEPDVMGRGFCKKCGAKLRYQDGLVYEVGKREEKEDKNLSPD